MKYTILVYETAADFKDRAGGSRREAYWGAYRAYTQSLQAAGLMVGGAVLEPPASAATVRQRNDKRGVQDGPFAETTEQLGGYYVIDVPDLDTALAWASRCPAASTGAVEVRAHFLM